MSRIKKRTQIFRAIIEAISNKPETTTYPFTPLELPEGFRGAVIMLNPEKCTGCGLCVRGCPANALVLEKESRDTFRLIHYPARCAYCGQCEESCRHDAISHTNQLVGPTNNPDDIVELKNTMNENNSPHQKRDS
jgi:hydrogenase-4 component H